MAGEPVLVGFGDGPRLQLAGCFGTCGHSGYSYSLWDSSEISLKHGPSSGQSFSVLSPRQHFKDALFMKWHSF